LLGSWFREEWSTGQQDFVVGRFECGACFWLAIIGSEKCDPSGRAVEAEGRGGLRIIYTEEGCLVGK
jgi:hypothetical protein